MRLSAGMRRSHFLCNAGYRKNFLKKFAVMLPWQMTGWYAGAIMLSKLVITNSKAHSYRQVRYARHFTGGRRGVAVGDSVIISDKRINNA